MELQILRLTSNSHRIYETHSNKHSTWLLRATEYVKGRVINTAPCNPRAYENAHLMPMRHVLEHVATTVRVNDRLKSPSASAKEDSYEKR
eukprot:1217986-Pleurochrysis_carterae.AAC.2